MSISDQPRAPRDIVEHVLRLNDVVDAFEVAQEVVNEFTDAEVAYFALYRGYECTAQLTPWWGGGWERTPLNKTEPRSQDQEQP